MLIKKGVGGRFLLLTASLAEMSGPDKIAWSGAQSYEKKMKISLSFSVLLMKNRMRKLPFGLEKKMKSSRKSRVFSNGLLVTAVTFVECIDFIPNIYHEARKFLTLPAKF